MKPAAAGLGTAALLAGLLGWSGGRAAAAEEAVKVSVVRPALGDAAMIEVATRAWAELSADGVPAALVDDTGARAGASPEPSVSGDPGPVLTVTTYRRDGETVTDLELRVPARADLALRRTVVIAREAAEPKLLAIRAVEIVHGVLLEAHAALAREEAAAGSVAAVDDESPGEPRFGQPPGPQSWAVGTGMTLVGSIGGLGTEFGGVLRADYRPPGEPGVTLVLGAAAFGGAVGTTRGALSMDQALAVVELTYPAFARERLRPEVSLGAGVYHVGATFAPSALQPATSDSFWALALSGGAGVAAEIVPYLDLFVDARVLVAYPHPAAQLPGGGMATAADPALITSLGVQRTF